MKAKDFQAAPYSISDNLVSRSLQSKDTVAPIGGWGTTRRGQLDRIRGNAGPTGRGLKGGRWRRDRRGRGRSRREGEAETHDDYGERKRCVCHFRLITPSKLKIVSTLTVVRRLRLPRNPLLSPIDQSKKYPPAWPLTKYPLQEARFATPKAASARRRRGRARKLSDIRPLPRPHQSRVHTPHRPQAHTPPRPRGRTPHRVRVPIPYHRCPPLSSYLLMEKR